MATLGTTAQAVGDAMNEENETADDTAVMTQADHERSAQLVWNEMSTSQRLRQSQAAVRTLLRWMGEDPGRAGLIETPDRVVMALREMTAGAVMNPADILSKRFKADYDEMVIVNGIDFASMCEHHLLPFTGKASVAYIPAGEVVGLSKLARLVRGFAQRLQIQEQMTRQIADAIHEHVKPRGVGVIIRASHQCMACRGIRVAGATMVTSALLGVMREDLAVRTEFLRLTNGH